ncbi:SDR family NAD(P)-dependent oxidoreductase [Paenibacillus faecalis]|uniref:SDR family NAD(P)-dependent oxidoreductase n=1 Tax=Paenibacillus faecalis TaxID=2079532 RepID=UPI00131A575E|nr:SDR family oxidoreductase [Paenibacillus faecalis]
MSIWKDKVVIVTGATDGLGEFITKKLLNNDIKVIAMGRRNIESSYLKEYDNSIYVQYDFNDVANLRKKMQEILRYYGPVDILINNACHFESCDIMDLDYRDLLSHYNVNTVAPFIITQEVIPSMLLRDIGKIIMINTESSIQVRPEIAAYASSKSALLNISRALAQSLKNTSVTINSLLLGPLATDYYVENYLNTAKKNNVSFSETVSATLNGAYPFNTSEKLTPLETVFDTIEFLCKSEVNGVSWKVDGGAVPTIF